MCEHNPDKNCYCLKICSMKITCINMGFVKLFQIEFTIYQITLCANRVLQLNKKLQKVIWGKFWFLGTRYIYIYIYTDTETNLIVIMNACPHSCLPSTY